MTVEKSLSHGAIGFGFASYWRKIFKPITKPSNRNRVIASDSHLKTAPKCAEGLRANRNCDMSRAIHTRVFRFMLSYAVDAAWWPRRPTTLWVNGAGCILILCQSIQLDSTYTDHKIDFENEEETNWNVVLKVKGSTISEKNRLVSQFTTSWAVHFSQQKITHEMKIRFLAYFPFLRLYCSMKAIWRPLRIDKLTRLRFLGSTKIIPNMTSKLNSCA